MTAKRPQIGKIDRALRGMRVRSTNQATTEHRRRYIHHVTELGDAESDPGVQRKSFNWVKTYAELPVRALRRCGASLWRGLRVGAEAVFTFLRPPRTLARDMVQDREVNRDLVRKAVGLAGLWATAAIVLTVVKLIVGFRGDSNYLAAVLERTSLAGMASMSLATFAASLLPLTLVWTVSTVADPEVSSRARRLCATAAIFVIVLFSQVIPNLYVILAGVLYLLTRLTQALTSRRTKPTNTLELEAWGRKNRHHEDKTLRSLAQKALASSGLEPEKGKELVDQINQRIAALQPSPAMTKIAKWWLVVGGAIVPLALTAPTFSALYLVETTEGPHVAYMVRGSHDVLLIDFKSKTPTVWPTDSVLEWRLCRPDQRDAHWLYRPVGGAVEDENGVCPKL